MEACFFGAEHQRFYSRVEEALLQTREEDSIGLVSLLMNVFCPKMNDYRRGEL